VSITFTFAASDGEHDIIGIPCPLCSPTEECCPDEWFCDHWYAHYSTCKTREFDCNFSNSNAASLMRLVGLWDGEADFPYSGVIDPVELHELLLRNCTYPVCVNEHAGRVLGLASLAEQARQRGCKVGWA